MRKLRKAALTLLIGAVIGVAILLNSKAIDGNVAMLILGLAGLIALGLTFLADAKQKSDYVFTPIEKTLYEAIVRNGLPEPEIQYSIERHGRLVTIPDFAYSDKRVAIFCDGFEFHSSKEKLISDSHKRNSIAIDGWCVLTFWGSDIYKNPDNCAKTIAAALHGHNHG